jgi:hypothetical protein
MGKMLQWHFELRSMFLLLVVMLDNPWDRYMICAWVQGRVQQYWLPTQVACFPFTSPPVRHRVPSRFKRSSKIAAFDLELTENTVFFSY